MKVLLFGATGYIGKHVSAYLAKIGHDVTAIVRSQNGVPALEAAGVKCELGDLDNAEHLARYGRDHDAIVWIAQLMLEDENRVINTFINNLKGTNKALIFTSGTSLLSERTDGDWSENTYSEDDAFQPRRHIAPRLDIENRIRASAQVGVRGICIRPPLIWGNGGSKVLADIFHSALKTGAACYVGRGLNVYTNVHVDDLAVLYGLALEKGVAGALYHAVSGETNFRTLAEYVGQQLNLPTRSVTVAEAAEIWDKFMGPIVFAGCSRTRSPRARRELGWRPSPERLDIRDDCAHPEYANAGERAKPSWVRSGS